MFPPLNATAAPQSVDRGLETPSPVIPNLTPEACRILAGGKRRKGALPPETAAPDLCTPEGVPERVP
jgi:hypothetical protein